MTLSIAFWGTRGSIPTPGPSTIRYGGNTACVSVDDQNGHRLVLDAGSGIRALGQRIARESAHAHELNVLLSHTHWDHIQGLPFFRPLYAAGNSIRILGPRSSEASLAATLRGQMAPAVFPVPFSAIGSALEVEEIASSELTLPGFEVRTVPLCHPGGALGFSIRSAAGGQSFSYMTDNELAGPIATDIRANLVRFLQGTDTLIHDSMYFEAELASRSGWGHSSAVQATTLALEAGVRRLVLFHHDPDHDDAAVDRLVAEATLCRDRLGGALEMVVAAEGLTLGC